MTVSSPPPTTPTPSRSSTPPGPKGRWIGGNVNEFKRDRLSFFTDCARRFGDVVAIRLGPRRMWALNHPDLVEDVLVHKNRVFTKHFALRAAKPTLGEGLLTSEGDFWRRQRRLSQPAFHRDRIASYGDVMVEFTERMLRTWRDGDRRDAQADMMQLTLEIVAKTLFDADIAVGAAHIAEAMEVLMVNFTRRINRMVPVPNWLPVPENFRFRKAMSLVERTLDGIIAGRRLEGGDRGDLLSMLLLATDAEGDGSRMSDRQLRDEVVTLFMAGHETTANTMAWAWFLLARHPEVEAKLHEELDEVLADGRPPTVDDLPRLLYANMIITETLRVYPTAWLLGREAMQPVEIGGYTAPKGTTMWMSQWVIHRDPRWFDEPDTFRPDRWADGLAKRLPRYAYFPFGGGPRICIGNHFAQMEAVLLLATIARRFRLIVPEGLVPRPIPTMTLRPEGGLTVTLEERHSIR